MAKKLTEPTAAEYAAKAAEMREQMAKQKLGSVPRDEELPPIKAMERELDGEGIDMREMGLAIPIPGSKDKLDILAEYPANAGVGGAPLTDTPAPTPTGQWRLIAGDNLIPRGDNPRRINERAKSFLELVASVGGPAGIVTPLLGRPHPQLPGKIELLAGHRRRMAGIKAGLVQFPVVVRVMDDRTALEVLVFENLDRANLTPLEEARGVDLLLKSRHEPAEIAARMGKTVQWVARRAQLLQLTAAWKKWAEEKEVSAAHLELVARLPREAQDDLFEELTEDPDGEMDHLWMGAGTLSALRERIAEHLMELKGAPWDVANAMLVPKAGPCSECPKRSGCQPTLFGDPEDGGDRCLDRKCWEEKMAAFKAQREASLRKEHPGLVLIPGKGACYSYNEAKKGGWLESWQFTECKKSSEGAVPAMIVCGSGEGSLTWVKRGGGGTREDAARPAKVNAATKQAAASLDPAESARLLAERQEAHEQRRWAEVAKRLLLALNESSLPLAEEFRSAEGLLRLVVVFGTEALDSSALWMGERERTWRKVQMAYGMETLGGVWQMLKPQIRKTLEIYKVSDIGAETHAAIAGVAGLLCRDLAVLKAEVDAEIPEPKWEQLRRLAEAPAKPVEQKPAKGAKKTAKKTAKKGKPALSAPARPFEMGTPPPAKKSAKKKGAAA